MRPRKGLFNADSERLPASLPARLLRTWIPLVISLIGVVLLIADDFNGFGVAAFGGFAGAGIGIWLTNFLWRLGVSGDDERDLEARDRAYLAEHGHWPPDSERP